MVSENLRMKIAEWMNQYPDTCWADLVCWAVYPEMEHPFCQIFRMRHTRMFCGYCGKCPTMLFVPGEA